MAENQEAQGNSGNDSQKVVKAYEKNLKTLISIVGGEANLKPIRKVKKDVVADLVSALFKEETDEVEKTTKDALKQLLKNRVEMQRLIEEKKKELAKLETTKMKEFNEAATKLFDKINGLGDLEREYYTALTEAAGSSEDEETKE